jgi:hypothetical protein
LLVDDSNSLLVLGVVNKGKIVIGQRWATRGIFVLQELIDPIG